jgi:PAS domain S-box-containing protein
MSRNPVPHNLPDTLVLRAVEGAGEGIVIVDGEHPERPVTWVNPAFEKMTGFKSTDLVGRNLRVLQGGDRDQAGLAELREAMAGERGCSVLLRNYRPDGTMYWNQLRI